jgi:hypothetical protein
VRILMLVGCVAALGLVLSGCTTEETVVEPEELNPPLGLHSVTGNESVVLIWYTSNFEADFVGYDVYVAEDNLAGPSVQDIPAAFGETPVNDPAIPKEAGKDTTWYLLDEDDYLFENGTTYSFLVVAVDEDGYISYTSNIVEDTPRPEVMNVELTDQNFEPNTSALVLADFSVVACGAGYDTDGDVVCESFDAGAGQRAGLVGVNGAVVQDLGFMTTWDLADEAPPDGYVASLHSVEAVEGHVYAVWTADDHYAKLFVAERDSVGPYNQKLTLYAAYQTKAGNPEYAPGP